MPLFEPPVALDLPPVPGGADRRMARSPGYRLMRHYGPRARGRTVLKNHDGTYSTVDTPTSDQVDAAAAVYLGGHVYTVSATEAAALTLAGYPVAQARSYGEGTYGSGTYGGV